MHQQTTSYLVKTPRAVLEFSTDKQDAGFRPNFAAYGSCMIAQNSSFILNFLWRWYGLVRSDVFSIAVDLYLQTKSSAG